MYSPRKLPVIGWYMPSGQVRGLLLAVMFAGVLLAGGCPDPEYAGLVPPPMSGDYTGTYSVIHHWRDSIRQVTNWNYIQCTFDDVYYYFSIDSVKHTGYCFCRVVGEYGRREGLRLRARTVVPDVAAGCEQCDETEAPFGTFTYETRGDSSFFRLQDRDTFKELKLVKVGSDGAPRGRVM